MSSVYWNAQVFPPLLRFCFIIIIFYRFIKVQSRHKKLHVFNVDSLMWGRYRTPSHHHSGDGQPPPHPSKFPLSPYVSLVPQESLDSPWASLCSCPSPGSFFSLRFYPSQSLWFPLCVSASYSLSLSQSLSVPLALSICVSLSLCPSVSLALPFRQRRLRPLCQGILHPLLPPLTLQLAQGPSPGAPLALLAQSGVGERAGQGNLLIGKEARIGMGGS